MKKLYLIEGVPGAGKTSFAHALEIALLGQGETVHTYVEGQLHPADMAWLACLTKAEYRELRKNYPAFAKEMELNSSDWGKYKLLAYAQLEGRPAELDSYCASREVYDGRAATELYLSAHRDRWAAFAKDAEDVTIFECCFLQNPINELLLFRGYDEDGILAYLAGLVESVRELEPELIYLDTDTDAAIDRAAAQRLDGEGRRAWEAGVAEYIQNSPYGQREGLRGIEGLHEYFRRRRRLELKLICSLRLRHTIVHYDINNQAEELNKFLESLINIRRLHR